MVSSVGSLKSMYRDYISDFGVEDYDTLLILIRPIVLVNSYPANVHVCGVAGILPIFDELVNYMLPFL